MAFPVSKAAVPTTTICTDAGLNSNNRNTIQQQQCHMLCSARRNDGRRPGRARSRDRAWYQNPNAPCSVVTANKKSPEECRSAVHGRAWKPLLDRCRPISGGAPSPGEATRRPLMNPFCGPTDNFLQRTCAAACASEKRPTKT